MCLTVRDANSQEISFPGLKHTCIYVMTLIAGTCSSLNLDRCYKLCQAAQKTWLLRYLLCLSGPSSPSTTESRPTKMPITGGYNLTFPRVSSRASLTVAQLTSTLMLLWTVMLYLCSIGQLKPSTFTLPGWPTFSVIITIRYMVNSSSGRTADSTIWPISSSGRTVKIPIWYILIPGTLTSVKIIWQPSIVPPNLCQ